MIYFLFNFLIKKAPIFLMFLSYFFIVFLIIFFDI